MIENLRRWITWGIEPPPNAMLEGEVLDLDFGGSFPFPTFVPSAFVSPGFDVDGDYDLNADGGIRLPHVRTGPFGGPLGLYRGRECNNPNPLTCPIGQAAQPIVFGGAFYPYQAVEDELSALGLSSPCERYHSRRDYLGRVRAAAWLAVFRRWILVDDVDSIVAAADAEAARYPGCVPAD